MKEKRSQKADFSEKAATWTRHSGELFRLGSRCKTGRAEGSRRHAGGAALRARTGIRRKNPLRTWENASSVYRRQSDAASGRKRKNAAERKAHGGAAECVRSSFQPGPFRERFSFGSEGNAAKKWKRGRANAGKPEGRCLKRKRGGIAPSPFKGKRYNQTMRKLSTTQQRRRRTNERA